MKILAIGDPHGDLEKIEKIPIKDVDLILLTGDLGKADFARKMYLGKSKEETDKLERNGIIGKKIYDEICNSFIGVLKYLSKFAPIYSILGNIGWFMIKDYNVKKDEEKYGVKLPYLRREIEKIKNFSLVKNRLRIINGLRVGFLEYFVDACWVKEFHPKDYENSLKEAKEESEKAKRILKRFGKVDILICHQPPYGYLDKVSGKYGAPKKWVGKHAGSKVILDYIKKFQPTYVFCGHIHEGEGKAKIGKSEVYNLGVAGHKVVEVNE